MSVLLLPYLDFGLPCIPQQRSTMSPPPDCVAVPDPMPSTQTWVWNADPQLRLPPNLQLWPLRLVGHFLFEKKSIFASRSEFDQISKMRNYCTYCTNQDHQNPFDLSDALCPGWDHLIQILLGTSNIPHVSPRAYLYLLRASLQLLPCSMPKNNPKQSKTCVEYLDSDAIDIPIPLITCWYLMHWRVD